MAENGSELRKIVWSQAFPFVRLFQTFRQATSVNRLALAFLAVLLSYAGGRLLDVIWGQAGGVSVLPGKAGLTSEIDVYASGTSAEFRSWLRTARDLRSDRWRELGLTGSSDAAQQSARALVLDEKLRQELADLKKLVSERLAAGLAVIDKNTELSGAARDTQRESLIDAADALRSWLSGYFPRTALASPPVSRWIDTLLKADPTASAAQRGEDEAGLATAAARLSKLHQYEQLSPHGTFAVLLRFEGRCFAAAIQGACSGRWGLAAGALDLEPSMAGSILSAFRGLCWLLNQRPWFGVFLMLVNLIVFAFFGGAVCRSAAVESAREERITIGEAMKFAQQRYGGLLLAPVLPVLVFVAIAMALSLGGLVGAIPWLGEIVGGMFSFLALVGGFALSLIALAIVLGFHLMWPTIAAEGSDGFDALSRACSYVFSRIWHVGFYSLVLLVYGAFAFVIVRVVALLTLKFTHGFVGLGMNLDSPAHLTGAGKLDVLWKMPPWADLSLLPSTGETPFWGTLFNAELSGSEWLGAALLSIWVFALVGLVGAFIVSFFYCGSTQMYFLLRREVDATDFEEVYYEEPAEPLAPAAADATPPASPPAGEGGAGEGGA